MCHILFVLPFISLILFLFLPFEQALALYSFILLLCSILYWLIWRAMRRPVTTGIEGMIGAVGQVIQNGKRGDKVFVKGEIWDAICEEQVAVGESVEVIGLKRMQLSVRKRLRRQNQATSDREGTCH
jgi:membrane-bound serine protease (ClpP class)